MTDERKPLEWWDRIADPEDAGAETNEQHRKRWKLLISREMEHWETGKPCRYCGEWVGHWSGSADRPPCPMIPLNIPLQTVRPNCSQVYRHWIGDAIRAACEKRGAN